MTVLQALRMAVGYPLDETALERIVIDRKLTPEAPYTGQTPEFMLARADVYMALAVSPDVVMDGFSLTVADRSLLTTLGFSAMRCATVRISGKGRETKLETRRKRDDVRSVSGYSDGDPAEGCDD